MKTAFSKRFAQLGMVLLLSLTSVGLSLVDTTLIGFNTVTIAYAQGCGTSIDSDRDGLKDWEENCRYWTDLYNPDTDNDGLKDGVEVFGYGTDPLHPNTDGDGVKDGFEAY